MTERTLTTALKQALDRYPGVWQKHSDNFTTGVPDVSWTGVGATWWLEAKLVRRGSTHWDEIASPDHAVQFLNMRQLEAANGLRAVYVVWKALERGKVGLEVWLPSRLALKFNDGVKSPVAAPLVGEAPRTALVKRGHFAVDGNGCEHVAALLVGGTVR